MLDKKETVWYNKFRKGGRLNMKIIIIYLLICFWLTFTYWTLVYNVIRKKSLEILGNDDECNYILIILISLMDPFNFNFLIPVYNIYLFYRNFVLNSKQLQSEVEESMYEMKKLIEEEENKRIQNIGFLKDIEQELYKYFEEVEKEKKDKEDK